MASQQGQLQALITEIEALLGRAAPKLPWMGSGEVSEQRRVMGQALNYLKELQSTPDGAGWGLVASQGQAIAPTATSSDPGAGYDAADSQQVLQALLQEMQYLRAQMVQPLTSEVIALQQQRETLKNEVRQLEQERLQRAAAAQQPSPDWVNEIVTQLRSSLIADLTPKLQALPSHGSDDFLLSGIPPEQNLLAGAEPLPQLSPQQRLEQLRQIQSQTDGMLLKLDANLRAVFESLDQSIQSYCDTLNQGLDAMHGLGQQGEFIFRTFINHLAEQLQEEGSALAEQLASQQELARLRGDIDDSMDVMEDSETDAPNDLMDAVVDLDDVELDDLSEFDGDDDLALDEEVTLFQLDEEFEDWSDEEEDEAWSELEGDRDEEKTILQTEPIAWEAVMGQPTSGTTSEEIADDEPTVAYTEEIDALYDNLFGMTAAPEAAAATGSDDVEATVDEQLRQADTSAFDVSPPEAVMEPAIADPSPLPETNDTSLDLDFLLEASEPSDDIAISESTPDEPEPPLEALLGPELAAELSPEARAGVTPSDTITSLTELLPDSEQQRQPDPFATFDETADTFIPASPDENLLDTEREVARPQVDLDLDDDTFGMLSSDLSRLEGSTPDEKLAAPRLSDALELDDFAQDVVEPERPASGLDELDAAPPAEPTLDEVEASSLDFTALEMDEETDEDADQLEADEEALFAELFDDGAASPSSEDMEADATPTAASRPSIDEVGEPTAIAEALTSPTEDDLPIEIPQEPTDDADLEADAELELTQLFDESDMSAESDALEWRDEDLPAIADSLSIAESLSDTPTAPPSDRVSDAEIAAADDDAATDDSPMTFELDATSDALAEDEGSEADDSEDDILPRLDLDELELFDEPTLGTGRPRDRPEASQPSDDFLDLSDTPATDADTTDTEASLEDFFSSPSPSSAAPSAVTEPPADAESLSLDSFFDEADEELSDEDFEESGDDTSDPADFPAAPESVAATLSTLFGAATDRPPSDSELEDETSDRDTDLTLDDAFGDPEIPQEQDSSFTLDDAFGEAESDVDDEDTSFTLDDAFGVEESSATTAFLDSPSDDESGFTLDDAFGGAEAEASDDDNDTSFTLDDAFGVEESSATTAFLDSPSDDESGFTLDDAFGEADDAGDRDANFTLEDAFGDAEDLNSTSGFTLENAFGDDSEVAEDAPNLTLDDVFGEVGDLSAPAADNATDFTLDDAFGDPEEPDTAPDSDRDFTLDNAFDEPEPSASPEATAPNTTLEDFAAAVSSGPEDSVPPVTESSLTMDDIGFDLGAAIADEANEPALTLDADLFGETAETTTASTEEAIAPDQLVDALELGDVPDEIAPIADDVSLETWGDTLDDAPSSASPEDDRLDFGNLGADLGDAPETELPSTSPEATDTTSVEDLFGDAPDLVSPTVDETSAPPEDDSLDFGNLGADLGDAPEAELPTTSPETVDTSSVEDLFGDAPDLVLPTIDEPRDRQSDAAFDNADLLGADDSPADAELPMMAEDLFAEGTDDLAAPPESTAPSESPTSATSASGESGLGITATADDGLQIVSDAPSEALMQSLATLPDSAVAADLPVAPSADSIDASLPQPESTVSGSIADGYQLSFATAPSDAAINRALIGAPEITAVGFAPDADAPSSSQQQRDYGRRLTSWQGMVAATSLPFSTGVDLSNLAIPDPGTPVSPASTQRPATDLTSPAMLPESELTLTGSAETGFAIAQPDPPSLVETLWPELAADEAPETDAEPETTATTSSDAELAVAPESANAPLTDDELATLFPPEANVVDVGSTDEPDNRELSESVDADETGSATAELAEPESPSDDTPPDDTDLAAASRTDEPAAPATDRTSTETEEVPPPEAMSPDAQELSQTLEALDLSMEEIPAEEIAADEAFQFAFDDEGAAVDRPEVDDEFLSAEAIADLDALTTDQEILPTARETTPAESPESTPEAPAAPETTDFTADTDNTVFASSGRLATLGDEPETPLPDDEEPAAPAEEWFLGIDLGTSGLSAVLMEHHSGSAHPLCWLPIDAPTETAATFRIPTVATVPTATLAGEAPFELLTVGPATTSQPAANPDQRLLHTLRPLLRVGIPHHDSSGMAIPGVQWSDTETLPLQQVLSTVTALLQLVSHPESAGLHCSAIGLEADTLTDVLANLQGVVMGLPTHWSDTYCFNVREAILTTGLVETADQVFFVEEAIAALLSGLPDPSEPAPPSNRPAQALYQCHWQGGTVVIGSGAACTEVGIVDLPQPLDTVSREDWKLRNLAYGGDALDLDIICQLLIPSERRQPLTPNSRRSPNRGWGWQAALPEVANAHWADLELDGIDLPRLAEPDAGLRQQLRQHLESSPLGQSLLEAARYLKLILQHQNHYQLELADQSWRVLRRDLESRVLVPYIQRINQQVNALLSQTGLASQGINQVICTGGNASFSTIAKWLRQKFPNATIIQDTYPSNRPQTCSRVAYGLVNLCRYPQVLDMPRHQYSDYFLLHEMMRVIPDAPLPLDGILHLLEEQGINVAACQSRIVAILEGHLPPGLLPDMATRELLSRDTRTSRTYQDLAAGSLFTQQTRNIYMVNAAQRDRLQPHLALLMQDKQQSWTEPLIAQLVAV